MSEQIEFIKQFGSPEDKKAIWLQENKKYHHRHNEMILQSNRQIVCKDCDTIECTLTEEEYKDWMQQDAEAKQRKIAMQKIQPKYRMTYTTDGNKLAKISEGETDESFQTRLMELTKW